MKEPPQQETHQVDAGITVRVVVAEYRQYIERRYVNDYAERRRQLGLCATLEDEYGDDPADSFGPRKLSEIRDLFVAEGLAGKYVNRLTNLIKKIFRRAVSRELIDVNFVIRLDALEPLRAGQTSADQTDPVQPVNLETVQATAEHLSPCHQGND